MKLAIMQPYFLPYSGYFQLMSAVDTFVVYDNIKYTKKGWINRNRILVNGQDALFSLPLKKDSDALGIVQRELSSAFERNKLLNQFRGAYSRAPYFKEIFPVLEGIVNYPDDNLFAYLYHSLTTLAKLLGLKTQFVISSTLPVDVSLKGQEKVLSICQALDAQIYINAIGGQALYSKDVFAADGITLNFIHYQEAEYPQFGQPFIPYLSIVDVLMFNSLDAVRHRIEHNYCLV